MLMLMLMLQCCSVGRKSPKVPPYRWGISIPTQIRDSLRSPESTPSPKLHLDRFCRFCSAHECVQHNGIDTQTDHATLVIRHRPWGGAARRYAPADGSSAVAYRFAANHAGHHGSKIAADLRPSADRSAARTSLVAGGG